jgi:uncharacterized damage-inducible protein DinB
MTQRAAELADAFESAHAQVVQAVAEASAEQWTTSMADEQWPIGYGFYHLADGFELVHGWIEAGANGRGPTVLDPAAIDAKNALSLAAHPRCAKDEVLALCTERGRRLAELVRGLTDEQLARAALTVPDGTTRTVEQVASGPMLSHVRTHMASIKAATGLG